MTKQTVMAFTSMLTARNMKVTGQMTNSTEKERKHGQMGVNTMATMWSQRKKAEEPILGLMAISTSGTGGKMQQKDMVSTSGPKAVYTVVNGETT